MPSLADAELTFLRTNAPGALATDSLSDLRMKYYGGTGTQADRAYAWFDAVVVPVGTFSDLALIYYTAQNPIAPGSSLADKSLYHWTK